jgi:hypothetical protein
LHHVRSLRGEIVDKLFERLKDISPGLVPQAETREDLERQLKRTQEQLDKLAVNNGSLEVEVQAKNLPTPGMVGSR